MAHKKHKKAAAKPAVIPNPPATWRVTTADGLRRTYHGVRIGVGSDGGRVFTDEHGARADFAAREYVCAERVDDAPETPGD